MAIENQKEVDRYIKVKTVPGVEKNFTPGKTWTPLQTQWGKIGVLICFESIYPSAGRQLGLNGAELLIVLSNDAGFGLTPISHHMSNRARIRAIELGRWIVRVGQAGISFIGSPYGQLTHRLSLFKAGLVKGKVEMIQEKTGFIRWGHSWLILFALALPLPWFFGLKQEHFWS